MSYLTVYHKRYIIIIMESKSYAAKIGTLIQETRQNKGMTQSDLAKALKTSQSAINRIEIGRAHV